MNMQFWFQPQKVNQFPWLDDEQVKRLKQVVTQMWVTDIYEKQRKEQELYRKVIQAKQQKDTFDKRNAINNSLYYDTIKQPDPVKRNVWQAQVRMEDLADIVKQKYNLQANAPTNEVLQWFSKMLADQQVDPKLVEDYLNWRSEELLYVSGLKERPVMQQEQKQELPVKMSLSEFWQYIKNKYPQYENISDEELWQKMLEKYPEYSNMVDLSIWLGSKPGTVWGIRWQIMELWQQAADMGALERLNPVWKIASTVNEVVNNIPTMTTEDWDKFAKEKLWWFGEGMGAIPTMVVNAIPSFLKTISAIGSAMLNPVDTMVWLYTLVWTKEGHNVLWDRYGWIEQLSKTMTEDPVWLASDILTIVSGGAGIAWKWARIAWFADTWARLSKFSKTAMWTSNVWADVWIAKWWKALEWVADKWWKAGKIAETAKIIATPSDLWKTIWTLKEGWKAAISTIWKWIELFKEQVKWLSKQQQKAIENNPYVKEMWAEVLKSVDEWTAPHNLNEVREPHLKKLVEEIDAVLDEKKKLVSENWEGYNALRKDPTKYDTKWLIKEIDAMLEGTTYTAESFLKMVDEGNLLKTWDILNGEGTTAQLHDVRKGIDSLLKKSSFEKNQGRVNMLNKIRKLVDEKLKENWDWKSLDENYSKIRNEISQIEEWITYKEKRRQWQFRDNVDNIIANINNPAKANLKARLAEYFPDLSERVAAIQMLPEIAKTYSKVPKTKWQQIVTTWLWWAIGGWIWWLPWAIAWWVLWLLTDLAMTKARKTAVKNAVNKMSPEAKTKLNIINEKISQNQKLNAEQMSIVKNLVDKIKQEAWLDTEFNNAINKAVDWLETKASEPLSNLNPTNSVFAEYTPEARATAPLWKNITTLADTMWKSPNETITIYRGVSTEGWNIVPWDYITTNKQLAQDYAWNGKVVSKKVRLWDILDDITEPLGEEYIYRPKAWVETPTEWLGNLWKTKWKTMDAKIPELKATVKAPDEALYKEARKYKSAEEFIESKIDDYVNSTKNKSQLKQIREEANK